MITIDLYTTEQVSFFIQGNLKQFEQNFLLVKEEAKLSKSLKTPSRDCSEEISIRHGAFANVKEEFT